MFLFRLALAALCLLSFSSAFAFSSLDEYKPPELGCDGAIGVVLTSSSCLQISGYSRLFGGADSSGKVAYGFDNRIRVGFIVDDDVDLAVVAGLQFDRQQQWESPYGMVTGLRINEAFFQVGGQSRLRIGAFDRDFGSLGSDWAFETYTIADLEPVFGVESPLGGLGVQFRAQPTQGTFVAIGLEGVDAPSSDPAGTLVARAELDNDLVRARLMGLYGGVVRGADSWALNGDIRLSTEAVELLVYGGSSSFDYAQRLIGVSGKLKFEELHLAGLLSTDLHDATIGLALGYGDREIGSAVEASVHRYVSPASTAQITRLTGSLLPLENIRVEGTLGHAWHSAVFLSESYLFAQGRLEWVLTDNAELSASAYVNDFGAHRATLSLESRFGASGR